MTNVSIAALPALSLTAAPRFRNVPIDFSPATPAGGLGMMACHPGSYTAEDGRELIIRR